MENLIEKAIFLCCSKLSEGKSEEAEVICEQILKVEENDAALHLLAEIKNKLNKKQERENLLDKIELNCPKDSDFINSIGVLLFGAGCVDSAAEYFLRAIKENSQNHQAWSNLAGLYKKQKMFDMAANLLSVSLKCKEDKQSLVNLAQIYGEMRMIDKAIECLRRALEIDPEFTAAQVDLACALHLSGEWDEAWELYANRYKHYPNLKKKLAVFPEEKMWNGEEISNKKVLVFSEQGIGDTFNFISFVKLLDKKIPGNQIKVFVPESIRQLMKNQGFNITDNPNDFDVCCPMMDLPRLLGLKKNEVLLRDFFKPSKECDFSAFSDKIKIGICWAGNPAHPRDEHRSCSLSLFKKIHDIPNVKLFSLQFDVRPRVWSDNKAIDLAKDCADMRIVNMQKHMETWEDTAAIISGLDLIVSVDTSLMHLAAAMGKPTFGLIPYLPDWRWGLESEDNLWYPTLRLFRQKNPRSWEDVFEKVVEEIKKKGNFYESKWKRL